MEYDCEQHDLWAAERGQFYAEPGVVGPPEVLTMRLLKGLLLATALGAGHAGAAQQIGTNATPSQNGAYTLTVKSQLVVEAVVVKDKKGNFISGLTAKDFTVTEDGAPQTIRFCEHQELPLTADPLPATPQDQEEITIYKRLTHTQIAPEDPGRRKHRWRRRFGERWVPASKDRATRS